MLIEGLFHDLARLVFYESQNIAGFVEGGILVDGLEKVVVLVVFDGDGLDRRLGALTAPQRSILRLLHPAQKGDFAKPLPIGRRVDHAAHLQ